MMSSVGRQSVRVTAEEEEQAALQLGKRVKIERTTQLTELQRVDSLKSLVYVDPTRP